MVCVSSTAMKRSSSFLSASLRPISLSFSLSLFPCSQLGTMHASFCVVCFHGDGRWICRQLCCFPSPPRFPPSARPRSSSFPSSSSFFVRDVGPFSPSFRDVFLVLRLAASLFPTLSPGEDSSVRAQPLAYNETENLRGTRGMRRMITYIETKNRPARRSAALSLFLSRSSSSLLRLPKTPRYFHLAERTVANRVPRSSIISKRSVSKRLLREHYEICFYNNHIYYKDCIYNIDI